MVCGWCLTNRCHDCLRVGRWSWCECPCQPVPTEEEKAQVREAYQALMRDVEGPRARGKRARKSSGA